MTQWLAVAAGGALGAVGRFILAGQITRLVGTHFPWGTLGVNVLGSFAMGLLVELIALKWSVTPELRAFLTVGLLGGFTTFSAFSLEAATMLERGALAPAALYAIGSVGLCVAALFLGLLAIRGLVG